jgi:hypothetical protein
MAKSATFQQNGQFALQLVHYFLVKAAETREQGLKPTSVDYTWKAFEGTHSSIVDC